MIFSDFKQCQAKISAQNVAHGNNMTSDDLLSFYTLTSMSVQELACILWTHTAHAYFCIVKKKKSSKRMYKHLPAYCLLAIANKPNTELSCFIQQAQLLAKCRLTIVWMKKRPPSIHLCSKDLMNCAAASQESIFWKELI